jgi:glycine amidinotransferase/scyllo-inosamine-4-phosphate amidinotransferase 1
MLDRRFVENKPSINVHNEWDPIEEIVVGRANHAQMPEDMGMDAEARTATDLNYTVGSGPFPDQIIEETNEDLEVFVTELVKLGITVQRPNPDEFTGVVKTPLWTAGQYFCYCPRDVLMCVGDQIIESPGGWRSRYFETIAYKDILLDHLSNGARWISAPKPRLDDKTYNLNDPNSSAIHNIEPIFDAANVIKAGRDIFYLVSDSGNEMGCHWLQTILGDEYRVHPCRDLYSGAHIDSTLCLLRPGLVLANPERVNDNNLPEKLKSWDILYAPEMIEKSYSEIPSMSSKWLGMNLLMLSPDLAVVDAHQTPLISALERKGIDVLPLSLRHGRQLGGGFHCVTLDTRRTGTLETYD